MIATSNAQATISLRGCAGTRMPRAGLASALSHAWKKGKHRDNTRQRIARFGRALAWLVFALVGIADAVAQTPPPLAMPDPHLLKNGVAYCSLRLTDGSLIVGGKFSEIGGVTLRNIARIDPNGEVDRDWQVPTDGAVFALASGEGGDIYVGGAFTVIGGIARNHIARISAAATVDLDWNASASAQVDAIVPDGSGYVYVGVFSGNVGAVGSSLARIAVAGNGSADAGWNPGISGAISTIVIDAGHVYAGGTFGVVIAGQTARSLLRFSTTNAAVDSAWTPNPNSSVAALTVDGNTLYVGGDFTTIAQQPRARLAKLSTNGPATADPQWNPGADGAVYALAKDGPDSLYVGGSFRNIAGHVQPYIAKLARAGVGAAAADWSGVTSGTVRSVEVDTDAVWAVGLFSSAIGVERWGLAKFDRLGALKATDADLADVAQALAFAAQSDGSMLVGGDFLRAGTMPRTYLLKLDPDGAVDAAWSPSPDAPVYALAVDTNDDVYAGGQFANIGDVAHARFAKLDGAGTGLPDSAWNLSADGAVTAIAVDEGNVFVGGVFHQFGGVVRNALARVGVNGALDVNWNPNANAGVSSLALDSDGLYAGGYFTNVNGVARTYLVKLARDGAGSVVTDWAPQPNNYVYALALDGTRLFVGGAFTSFPGHFRQYVAQLGTQSGAPISPWAVLPNGYIYALMADSRHDLYIGGGFSQIGSTAVSRIAAFHDGSGSPIAQWNPAPSALVESIAEHPSGVIVVGGAFDGAGDQPRFGLAAVPRALLATSTSIVSTDVAGAAVGQDVTVRFVVTAATGAAVGTVVLGDDAGASCGPVTLVSGAGNCVYRPLHAGTRQLVATFTATDDRYATSTSPAYAFNVAAAHTALMILSQDPARTTPAQSLVVQARLDVLAPGGGIPAGAVVVGDGVDSCSIPSGQDHCELTLTTRGERNLQADFSADGDYQASSYRVTHLVNRLPVPQVQPFAAREDQAILFAAAQGVLAGASDADGDALSIADPRIIVAGGIGGRVELRPDGGFAYLPPADANGTATFDYTLSDGSESVAAHASIDVSPVNDAPHFSLSILPALPAGSSGKHTQPGFAHVIDFGPPNESNQHVAAWLSRTLENTAGVVSDLSVALDGTLHYTLTGQPGTATFAVRLRDSGGTADGGTDTSDEQTFSITVTAGTDLSVQIDDGLDFVPGGGVVEYMIRVHNAGPDDVVGAHVTSVLPLNVDDAQWTCAPDAGAQCTAVGSGDLADEVTLASGADVVYTLVAHVAADPEMPVVTTVSVESPESVPDLVAANDAASDTDAVGIFRNGFERSASRP